jgi:branched-chain amino acid transport system substrate-binding protein
MRTRSFSILVLLVTVVALASCGPKQTAYECTDEWGCAVFAPGQTIKIPYIGPMTGDYAAFGTDISRGAELAVRAHPSVQGFNIEMTAEDDQGSPEQAAAVANRLAADSQVVAVVGHTFSGATLAAVPIYEEAHIPMMSPSTTMAQFTAMGSQVYNRVAPSDRVQADKAANYLYNVLGVRRIVLMHDGGAYGQNLAIDMGTNFTNLGGSVLGDPVAITPGETDYSAPLASIAPLEPELIYFGGYDADAAVIVSQMAGAGLVGVKFFGCDGTYGVNFIDLAGAASEGAYSTYIPIPPSSAFDQFRADYQTSFGDEQGKLSPFSPHGYDAMAILINAVEQVAVKSGDNLIVPRKALAEAVRATANYHGLLGTLSCDSTGECGPQEMVFMIVQNGEWVEAPGQ